MNISNDTLCQSSKLVDVWASNLTEELTNIAALISEGYNHVAIDTEYPGLYFKPKSMDCTVAEQYAVIKMNVDKLKPIQIGLSFTNAGGKAPEKASVWQFHMKFDLERDFIQPESLSLLIDSKIPFDRLPLEGICANKLSDGLLFSGLPLNTEIVWICFHGSYDFAYLIKILSGEPLPNTIQQFNDLRKHLCPKVFDIKMMIQNNDRLKKYSLARLAQVYGVSINGPLHQAGTDARLTSDLFFKMKAELTDFKIAKFENKIFSISKVFTKETLEFESSSGKKNMKSYCELSPSANRGERTPFGSNFANGQHGAYGVGLGNFYMPVYASYGSYVPYGNNIGYMFVNNTN